jgi:serine/threonine-protein kinase RsbT
MPECDLAVRGLPDMEKSAVVQIIKENDIILARKMGRELARSLHFNPIDQARILTVISELARNIYRYAGRGQIQFDSLSQGDQIGLRLTAIDCGPGIADIPKALKQGYSSSNGLGAGLPAVERMMDEFCIDPAKKWAPKLPWLNGKRESVKKCAKPTLEKNGRIL